MSEELYKIGAYHEVGHAVVGYWCGFEVHEIVLSQSDPGSGYTRFDYLEDSNLVNAIFHSKKMPELFNQLPKEVRSRLPQVNYKVCCTVISGKIAEAIFVEGIEKDTYNIGFSDPDYSQIIATEYVNQIVKGKVDPEFLLATIKAITVILKQEKFWKVIEEIVGELLSSTSKRISKSDLQKIFDQHGFIPN